MAIRRQSKVMFYSLRGNLIKKGEGFIALETSGVGFKILTTPTTLGNLKGKRVKLFTSVFIRREKPAIYGFLTEYEVVLFEALVDVSGVGPKKALAILEDISPKRIKLIIAAANISALDKVSGIGKKTAQKIISKLKEKLRKSTRITKDKISESDNLLTEALMSLGYSTNQILKVIKKIPEKLVLDKRLKLALQELNK